MCGLAGIINYDKKIDKQYFNNFLSTINHRGPDDKSITDITNGYLGHTRLAIYDLSTNANQPMETKNGEYLTLFNGAIYNYMEIKKFLISKGYKFYTTSDTEVIWASYDYWGKFCVNKFNGMWAFVLYNQKNNTFFISRDRFGKKPFYYIHNNNKFIFSSELKSFCKLDEIEFNYDYISSAVKNISLVETNENTIIKGVKKLLPGFNINIDSDKKIELTKWYDFKKILNKSDENIKNIDLEKQLEKACLIRTTGDVDVSSSISGGLDSSIIYTTLLKYNKNIEGFHINYTDKNYNEIKFVEELENSTNTQIKKEKFDEKITFEDIKKNLFYLDDAYFHTVIGPYQNFKNIKSKGYKVTIDGQGADELFGGYSQILFDYITNTNLFYFLFRYFKYYKIYNAFLGGSLTLNKNFIFLLFQNIKHNIFKNNLTFKLSHLFFKLIKKDKNFFSFQELTFNKSNELKDDTKNHYELKNLKDYLAYYLLKKSLPNILRIVDRVSMQNAVEVRMPFLDYRIVELASLLKNEQLYKNGYSKFILRDIFKKKLPNLIVKRKNKIGFADPTLLKIFKQFNKNLLEISSEKDFLMFPAWNGEKLSILLKSIIKKDDFYNFEKIWPYINYYILYKEFKKYNLN